MEQASSNQNEIPGILISTPTTTQNEPQQTNGVAADLWMDKLHGNPVNTGKISFSD